MSTSQSEPTASPRPNTASRRRLLAAAAAVIVFAWALWYNQHRNIGWIETFNPVYWWHRAHGDDLYNADTAFLSRGNRSLPEIALTFDDGPHIESRARILDILKRYNVHAVFLDVGMRMTQNPDLVLRTLAEGHEIGNHSYNHNRLDTLNDRDRHREINDVDIAFYRITGRHLSLLRPPGMRFNDAILAETKSMGYLVVGYTTAARDFDTTASAEFISDRTIARTENGSILLLHDYPGTADALPHIIETLRRKGYRFVTVTEMIAHLPDKQRAAAQTFLRANGDAAPAADSR